ncbi:MAG: hypothetical protein KGV50_02480 [Gammaproteobacteria bacterium]|nr:hypothetical protein [Gammaproteobacteria bacterium]
MISREDWKLIKKTLKEKGGYIVFNYKEQRIIVGRYNNRHNRPPIFVCTPGVNITRWLDPQSTMYPIACDLCYRGKTCWLTRFFGVNKEKSAEPKKINNHFPNEKILVKQYQKFKDIDLVKVAIFR